jgi:hypothetical protein
MVFFFLVQKTAITKFPDEKIIKKDDVSSGFLN